MSTPRELWPTANELAREEAEDRLDDCIASGEHLAETNEYDRCLACGWAAETDDTELLGAAA